MTGLKPLTAITGLLAWITVVSCATRSEPATEVHEISELWVAPTNLEERDLFYGPGGRSNAPDSNGRFTLTDFKQKGWNPGYDATDEKGREWSIKLGVESRVEVTLSRIL